MTNHLIKIPIGDWSNDGHGRYKVFEIESSHPVFELQEAYKASCKLVGVQFNHNENYMGIEIKSFHDNDRIICTDYEDSFLSVFAYNALKDHGINFDYILEDEFDEDESIYLNEHEFTKLLLHFIGLSMPKDWEWEFTGEDAQYLNGFWNGNLNHQFGYGLFD